MFPPVADPCRSAPRSGPRPAPDPDALTLRHDRRRQVERTFETVEPPGARTFTSTRAPTRRATTERARASSPLARGGDPAAGQEGTDSASPGLEAVEVPPVGWPLPELLRRRHPRPARDLEAPGAR